MGVSRKALPVLAALGLALICTLAAFTWVAGVRFSRFREQAYPLPPASCATLNCDTEALRVQRREAITADAAFDVALGQLALNVLGLGGLAFTALFAGMAWGEAKRSADLADQALRTLERPFIVVEITEPGIEFRGNSRRFGTTKYHFKNYGRSPAIITREHFVIETPKNLPQPIDPLGPKGRRVVHGMVIPPNGETMENEAMPGVSLRSSLIAHQEGRPQGGAKVYFMGFVRYRDLGGSEYVTGYCFFHDEDGFGLASPRSSDGNDYFNYDRRLNASELAHSSKS